MKVILLANLLVLTWYLPKPGLKYTFQSVLGTLTPEDTSRNRTVTENDLITPEELKINPQYRRLMCEQIAL